VRQCEHVSQHLLRSLHWGRRAPRCPLSRAPLSSLPHLPMPASVNRIRIRLSALWAGGSRPQASIRHPAGDMGQLNTEQPPDSGDGGGGLPMAR